MAVPLSNSSNTLFPSSIILLCSLFFMLYYFPLHATALSSNFTNIDQKLQDINITAYEPVISPIKASKSPQTILTQTDQTKTVEPHVKNLFTFGTKLLTASQTSTPISCLPDENVDYGDGLTFFLVPYDSTLNITKDGAIGLPADQTTGEAISPFVAVEFDTLITIFDLHVLSCEATLPILPTKMPMPTYFAPPVNASSLVFLTYGSATVSSSNQVQSSSYSYNTNSSKFTSSSAAFSP